MDIGFNKANIGLKSLKYRIYKIKQSADPSR